MKHALTFTALSAWLFFGGIVAGPTLAPAQPMQLAQQTPASPRAGCVIKGNISSKGERIYHVPGGRYYARTVVNIAKGERWFCTEAEARAAGWRRSKV